MIFEKYSWKPGTGIGIALCDRYEHDALGCLLLSFGIEGKKGSLFANAKVSTGFCSVVDMWFSTGEKLRCECIQFNAIFSQC